MNCSGDSARRARRRIALSVTPEERHRLCWYGRRANSIPPDLGLHTIVDGQLVYCGHPMWWPIVGYEFDVSNCSDCEYFRLVRSPR